MPITFGVGTVKHPEPNVFYGHVTQRVMNKLSGTFAKTDQSKMNYF
jgi:hypothetical protein